MQNLKVYNYYRYHTIVCYNKIIVIRLILKVVCPLTELRNLRYGFGAMKDFEKFFEDVPSDSLSAVIGWTKWFQDLFIKANRSIVS